MFNKMVLLSQIYLNMDIDFFDVLMLGVFCLYVDDEVTLTWYMISEQTECVTANCCFTNASKMDQELRKCWRNVL